MTSSTMETIISIRVKDRLAGTYFPTGCAAHPQAPEFAGTSPSQRGASFTEIEKGGFMRDKNRLLAHVRHDDGICRGPVRLIGIDELDGQQVHIRGIGGRIGRTRRVAWQQSRVAGGGAGG